MSLKVRRTPARTSKRMTREFVTQLVIGLSVLFVSLVFYVWTRYHAVHLGYELGAISRQERQLFEEQQALNLELNNLTSLERLERLARNDLSLHEPQPEQIVYIKENSR